MSTFKSLRPSVTGSNGTWSLRFGAEGLDGSMHEIMMWPGVFSDEWILGRTISVVKRHISGYREMCMFLKTPSSTFRSMNVRSYLKPVGSISAWDIEEPLRDLMG